jgi:hypothetical protein
VTKLMRFAFLLWLVLGHVLAQDLYRPLPGAVPLQYGGYPATDLVLNQKVLLPEEAHRYYTEMNRNTRGRWTLAELQPQETDIWKNILSAPLNSEADDLPIKDQLDNVSFASFSLTRMENYRFTVAKDHSFYLAYMGPKVHNFLLRKNLLRKLGYRVPPVKYLKSLKVEFKDASERDDFISDFQATVGRDIERWITNAPAAANYFYAQDLIVMEDQNTLPNLSVGYLAEEIIDGRRVFNSLLLPYALTDMPESINMFSWAHGRIYSENVLLPYEHSDAFTCTNDDAVWMAKRILALTEADWKEIVESTHMPEPVQALLLEKLKARRNNLATLFRLKDKKFKIDSKLTDQDAIVKDGKLEQEFFEGYGRRFKMPDPDSPLSYGEMSSVFKTKAMNIGIELLVSAMNSAPFLGSQIDDKIAAINEEVGVKAEAALKEGKPLSGLVESYAFPTVSGKLILSRDVVAGSYLGTDNLIQLVDTVGVSINAGMVGGLAGVFSKTGSYSPALKANTFVPVSLGGSANASFTRSYAHVKPITSVKKALKYPFKNVFIPMVKKKVGKTLFNESEKDFDKINAMVREAREKEYEQIFEAINTQLEIGESMIITDSITIGGAADAGVSLYGVVNARVKVGGNSLVVSRLHILRKSQTVIQVYKDIGQNNGYEVTLGLDQVIPLVKVAHKANKGYAQTKFYNVNLVPGSSDFRAKLDALSAVFKHNSLSTLDKGQKPYVVKHNFNEKNPGAGLLIFRLNHVNSVDRITVAAPTGEEKKFVRRYKGHSIGMDFESYLADMIGLFSSKLLKTQFSTSSFSQNNPGYTFHGKAFTKVQIYEGELDENNKVQKPFTRLTRIWNGWQIKQKNAIKILTNMKERYKFNFMPEEVLAQTKKLFLYNFNVNLYVHKEGIAHLMSKDDKAMEEMFLKFQSRDMTNYTGDDALVNSGIKRLIRWKKKYLKEMEKNDLKGASNYLLSMVSLIERKLTVEGYEAAFGSKANFLLLAKIEGFRIGDENGDKPIVSNTFGMVGNDNLNGPTADVLEFFRFTGSETMTEGEFYVNWLLGRLI